MISAKTLIDTDGIFHNRVKPAWMVQLFQTESYAIAYIIISFIILVFLTLAGIGPWCIARGILVRIEHEKRQYHEDTSIASLIGVVAFMIIVWLLVLRCIARGSSIPEHMRIKSDMTGTTAIVTGSNTGIGKAIATQLAKWGAHVIMACRDIRKAELARIDILAEIGQGRNSASVQVIEVDLADLQSIRNFLELIQSRNVKIDILVNNAGFMATKHFKTEDNQDLQFATNSIGTFYLTNLLLDNIKKNNGRIINISSVAHCWIARGGEKMTAADFFDAEKLQSALVPPQVYGLTKACNIWFTQELQRRLALDNKTTATAYCCHPGFVASDFGRHAFPTWSHQGKIFIAPFAKTPLQGAQTALYLCAESKANLAPGAYYVDCRVGYVAPWCDASRRNHTKELWDRTALYCKMI